jgi:hypothetical protein
MDRTYIINYVAKKINAKNYLEIGTDNCINFNNINIENKTGVDPYPKQDNITGLTSDEFFKTNNRKFDIIFIDGLHHADQVYRDIVNSLDILNPGGYIFCHDMLPTNEQMQIIPFNQGMWTGDCWRAFVELKQTRDDLEMFTIDIDMGIGVIRKGKQEKLNITEDITYHNFSYHKHKWMNIYPLPMFYTLMGETDTLKILLDHYIHCSDSPEANFYMGYHYHSIGQTASAVSYYLRAAERTYDDLVRYESLLRAGMCFEAQGCRNNSVEGMYQHAVALMPHRPEGYFYLSRFYERAQKWFNAYTISSIGDKVANRRPTKLKTVLDYPGFYGVIFEKAVSAWWCGLCEESRNIFRYLMYFEPLDSIHKQATIANLKLLKLWKEDHEFSSVHKTKQQELEAAARDLNTNNNYSEAYQDVFVLTMLNNKTEGTYLEIGAGYPFFGNNTYLLESEYKWKGVSLDVTPESIERYFRDRNNIALLRDATQVDYADLLEETKMPTTIDYLQLDCDPSSTTYEVLTKIPFDKYKFAVITYEHDNYNDKTKSYKQKSREYLLSKGYELVLTNIASQGDNDYEDWYVHPDLVSRDIIDQYKNTDDTIKIAKDLFI